MNKMSNLYVIDGTFYIYSGACAPMMKLTTPSGEPTTGTYLFTGEMLKLLTQKRPDMIIVALDSHAKPTFRKEIYEGYKGTRSERPDGLDVQIKRSKEIMGALGVKVIETPGFEADDIIGTVATMGEKAGHQVIICTRDKDLLQLVTPNVTIWEIKSGQTTDVVGVKEKWGIEPIQLVDFLALQGDPADNIPGVRGIGPKKAVDLIQRFGCIESIYEKLHMVTGKLRDTLFEGKNMALLSKKLATIVRDAPIDTTLEDMIWRGPTMSKIVPLFNELGFRKHLATVQGNWR
jgi:DNA polymerase-1